MDLNLKDKRALVFGSSQGIGKAVALGLAQEGAAVILAARSKEKLVLALEEIQSVAPHKYHDYLVVDLSKPEEALKKVKEKTQEIPIHILVNNSGGPPPGPVLEASISDFETALNSHLFSSHLITRYILPKMEKERYGRIINIISTSVRIPIPNLGVSNTVRGAMASWAKTLSNEVGSKGITVNNVLPGFTRTERLKSLLQDRAKKSGKSYEELVWALEEQIPLGRFGEAEEIAHAVVFLASSKASYITGQSILVDGGRTGCI
ncbi:MAG: SDR family oxidoreductase [Planctomycetota bacterium]|nr:MAG: SDR family oxidoreductase [Planctomycetota bacterium]